MARTHSRLEQSDLEANVKKPIFCGNPVWGLEWRCRKTSLELHKQPTSPATDGSYDRRALKEQRSSVIDHSIISQIRRRWNLWSLILCKWNQTYIVFHQDTQKRFYNEISHYHSRTDGGEPQLPGGNLAEAAPAPAGRVCDGKDTSIIVSLPKEAINRDIFYNSVNIKKCLAFITEYPWHTVNKSQWK